jgi:hypothetical protein
MSFLSSNPILNADEHPGVIKLVNSFTSTKMGQIDQGRKKIEELARDLQTISGLSDVTLGRVRFVATEILTSLTKGCNPSEQMLSALCECTNLKNALQVEAVLFGNVAPIIEKFIEMSQVPYLSELIETLPEIVSKIIYNPINDLEDASDESDKDFGLYKIDANILLTYFDSIGFDKIPTDFDVMFINLLQRYECREGTILIPFNQLPSKEFLEQIIKEKDLYAKLIAQVLYLCVIDQEILFKTYTTRAVAFEVMKILGKDIYGNYLTKQQLMPFFNLVIEGIKNAKSKGISLEDFYLQKSFLDTFSLIISKDWLKQAASVYQLVKRIEIGCRKVMNRATVSQFDALRVEDTCDSHIFIYSKMMEEMRLKYGFRQTYPISHKNPFCHSAQDFENLVLTNFFSNISISPEIPSLDFLQIDQLQPRQPKSSKKHGKKHVSGPSVGGIKLANLDFEAPEPIKVKGGCELLVETSIADLDKKQVAMQPKEAFKPLAHVSTSPDEFLKLNFLKKLQESIQSSFDFLQTVEIHPRVDAWRISSEKGLEYYHFDSVPSSHHLSREDMVKGHRFPEIFFSIIFNRNYSKVKQIQKENSHFHDFYRAIVVLNEKKHMLEATLNDSKVLYHFYLRPIKRLGDYLEIAKDVEFPPLALPIQSAQKPMRSLDLAEFSIDPQGDICLSYEQGNCKILYLGLNKDPKFVS